MRLISFLEKAVAFGQPTQLVTSKMEAVQANEQYQLPSDCFKLVKVMAKILAQICPLETQPL